MPNIQLANNLRYLKKQNKLTQKDLSEMLNISRQAYSNYETSKRTPDLDSLLYLAGFYNVNLDSLVLGSLPSPDQADAAASESIAEQKIPYTLSVDKNTGNSIYLTEEELEIITKIRTLSRENKQIITGFINDNAATDV